MTSRIPPEQVIADMLLAIRLEERMAERERIVKMLEDGAVLCAGGCGCFVDGGEGDPTCANCY